RRAAGSCQAALRAGRANHRATSRRLAPIRSNNRTKRSMLTDGSPASIFATRDWLDPSRRPEFALRLLLPHSPRESELQVNDRLFFRRQSKEVLGRSDLPTGLLQAPSLLRLHRFFLSRRARSYASQRSRRRSTTFRGVFRILFS